ncbi:MAG TPA: hypothetical protein VGK71_03125 [Nitrospirota bacterium]
MPGFRGGILGAAAAALLLLAFPWDSCASVSSGLSVTHQSSSTATGATSTSLTQDKFSMYFNLNSRPASRLSMSGILRFDVLENSSNGSKSTEIQPNMDLRIATNSLQTGLGYREITRNETILQATNRELVSISRDYYIDTVFSAGRLPTIRLRYSLRDQKQTTDGTINSDSGTKDLQFGTNYRIGIVTLNADFRNQQGKDNVTGVKTATTQIVGQASAAKNLGPKMSISLRDNFDMLKNKTGAEQTTRNTNAVEARYTFLPFRGANISTDYLYRTNSGNSSTAVATAATDKNWVTNFNYTMPRFFRFYGSYSLVDSDDGTTVTSTSATVGGLSFVHSIGRLAISSRYEKRADSFSSNSAATSKSTSSTTDNFDWVMNYRLNHLVSLTLSDSYVARSSAGSNSDTNQTILKMDIGPIKRLQLAPYVSRVVANTSTEGSTSSKQTTTEFILPMTFSMKLHQKLDLSFNDNLRHSISESGAGVSTTSDSNTAVIRMNLINPIPRTAVGADATFSTTKTSTGPTSTTSAYSIRANWAMQPHMVSVNALFQNSSNASGSATFAALYGLSLRLRKIAMALQARYDYTVTMATPRSTSQALYIVLDVKK